LKLCKLGIHDRETCECKNCIKAKHKLIEVNGKLLESTLLKQKTRNGVTTLVVREKSEVYYKCRKCDQRETRIEFVIKKITKMENDDEKNS